MAITSWSQQDILNQLDTESSWDTKAILYSFPETSRGVYAPNGETQSFTPLNTAQQDIARLAFATWGDLIAKPISQVNSQSHIELGNSTTNTEYAHAYFPTNSSIWFNTGAEDLQNPVVGEYGFEVFVHEIGHSLGLDHMGEYNGEGDWLPSCYEDSTVYSIMSYFGPDHMAGEDAVGWGNWSVDGVVHSPQTPMLNDVMTIQHIYGANTATRLGNTVYGFNTNISGSLSTIYDFHQNLYPILTLYDSGGTDTLDLSGWDASSRIDLTPGIFSDCNGMTNNISIAYACVIENAKTGSGNDLLSGNSAANHIEAGGGNDQLAGGLGDDILDGGDGIDEAIFLGALEQFNIGFDGSSLHVAKRSTALSDADTLANIEMLRFDDLSAAIHILGASPTGLTPNLSGLYANFQIYAQDGNLTLADKLGAQGVLIYQDIERLKLNDLTVALDIDKGESTGEVYRLYLSVLGRNPVDDPVGCGFWVDKLDRDLTDIEGLVQTFLGSKEFIDRFGSTTSTNESFVNLLYLNLLGRDGHPDPGFQFWKSILDNNLANRAQVVVGFMESPENVGNIAQLIGDHATFKTWVEG